MFGKFEHLCVCDKCVTNLNGKTLVKGGGGALEQRMTLDIQ
jgi:hypothetical protein